MPVRAWQFWLATLGLASAASSWGDILAYRATVTPDFVRHAVSGVTRITVDRHGDSALRFALHDLEVTDVSLDGIALPYRIDQGEILFDPAQGAWKGRYAQLAITYHGVPKEGLIFDKDYVASTWQACDWMICDEAPGRKAPIDLELLLPPGYQSLASGIPLGTQPLSPSLTRHEWRESRPYSSYLYGFAAGKFHQAREKAGKIDLLYFGVADDAVVLRSKFAPTSGMLAFLQEKAGLPMPHGAYRQLLIPGDEAQELSSFSVIGTEELDPMLRDPEEDWVIVHEMAHQWWGNLLTCKTWADFWLNEGITSFMVAAYKERRWGSASYNRELEQFKKRYRAAIDAGFDKPLTYGGEYPSLRIRRAIQYSKGALFMDALRRDIGDTAFWSGLMRYTRRHAGASVTSRDLQADMEYAAKRKLDGIFDKWVY